MTISLMFVFCLPKKTALNDIVEIECIEEGHAANPIEMASPLQILSCGDERPLNAFIPHVVMVQAVVLISSPRVAFVQRVEECNGKSQHPHFKEFNTKNLDEPTQV